jgi:hypothetical protein
MPIPNFDEKVLAHIRKYVPEGDVQATVSEEFAQTWLESGDSSSPQFSHVGSIDTYSGWSDGSGTLTYRLDPSLNGLSVLVPTSPMSFGDAIVMDVSDGLFE